MEMLKDRILNYVRGNPGKSATEISHALQAKTSSVASTLCAFTNAGAVARKPNGGPRRGYVYFVPPPAKPARTRFERILRA